MSVMTTTSGDVQLPLPAPEVTAGVVVSVVSTQYEIREKLGRSVGGTPRFAAAKRHGLVSLRVSDLCSSSFGLQAIQRILLYSTVANSSVFAFRVPPGMSEWRGCRLSDEEAAIL
eukprot:2062443-Amphidinium_carterae.1